MTIYLPPIFTSALISLTLKIGASLTYTLPPVKDQITGLSTGITVTQSTSHSFITFNASPFPGSLSINPLLNDFTTLGTAVVGLKLTISQGSKEYFMNVIVTNTAPVFTSTPLASTTMYLG